MTGRRTRAPGSKTSLAHALTVTADATIANQYTATVIEHPGCAMIVATLLELEHGFRGLLGDIDSMGRSVLVMPALLDEPRLS